VNLLNFEKNRASILNYINKNKEYSDLLIYISKVLPNLNEDNIELKINNIGTVNITYIEKYNCSMFSLIIKDRIVFISVIKKDRIENNISEELFQLDERDLMKFNFSFLFSDFCLEFVRRFLKSKEIIYNRLFVNN
jgi:hypothetical protein